MLVKRIFLLSLFILTSLLNSTSFADQINVLYAGFAFIGDNKDIESNYPHSFAISKEKDEEGKLVLEKVLREKVLVAIMINFNFIINELGNLNDGENVTVAFALSTETISIENICGKYKLVIDLGAQALFFDFKDMKVVGCYPIDLQLIDNLSTKPSEKYIRDRIRELFVSEKHKINIFDSFIEKLKSTKIKPNFSNSIQITNVIIEDKSLPFLPKIYQSDLNNCKTFIAQNFNKFLSNNQGVSVLPYTKGYAIGNKMAARFSNGEVYNLTIPEPQYEIELTLRGFKKVEFDSTKAEASWIYGSYINLKIFQPMLEKVYIDEKFKNGSTKLVPACQKPEDVDDWPAFQDSLFFLFDKVTKEFSTEKEFKPVSKILERCK
jgi:hypothetical protein